jgi:C1A family cysteine protease
MYKILNSWGQEWGDAGLSYLPYDYFDFVNGSGLNTNYKQYVN